MPLIIENASMLLGKELSFVSQGFIEINNDGIIKKADTLGHSSFSDMIESKLSHPNITGNINNNNNKIDAGGFFVIPGFINAHTHIGDSIGKDIAVDSGLETRVHPVFGIKQSILKNTRPDHLKSFMRASAVSMLKKGITAFADFREGGKFGVELLRDAISDLPIKSVILGRVESYFEPTGKQRKNTQNIRGLITPKAKNTSKTKSLTDGQLQKVSQVLRYSDGIGLSGANENTDESLSQYRDLLEKKKKNTSMVIKKPLLAIHAAESRSTTEFSKLITGKSEVQRIMQYLKPDFIVHMTNAVDEDFSLLAGSGCGIVICPRANGVIGAGIPKVARMLKSGCNIALGTDNVMLNSPDILREMDYIWKVSRATEGAEVLSAKDVLKMATVNAAEILRLNSGYIGAGRAADLIFVEKKHIDLYPIHNPHASIIHRASQDSIRAVMINGKFVNAV
jgi:cytosine/adenosine deaminase-related metal-dependent hydrolase